MDLNKKVSYFFDLDNSLTPLSKSNPVENVLSFPL